MNELQKFLDLTYHKVKEKSLTSHLMNNKTLDAIYNRVIQVTTPISCTENILEIFNKDTDLYVAPNLPAAKRFKGDLGQDCFIFSTGFNNANSLRGVSGVQNLERVFINVGADALFDKNMSARIVRTIEKLEHVLIKKPIYIIT